MDYSKLLQTVLDIAEEMLVAGAEVNRVEDSIERMISAYDCPFERVNVFIITTNIQTTFEDPDGNIIIVMLNTATDKKDLSLQIDEQSVKMALPPKSLQTIVISK